jgi:hypothetical protein
MLRGLEKMNKETVLYFDELEKYFPYFAKHPGSKARILALGLRRGTIKTIPFEDFTDLRKPIDLEDLSYSRKSITEDFDYTIARRQAKIIKKLTTLKEAILDGRHEDIAEAKDFLAKATKAIRDLEVYKLTYRYLEEVEALYKAKDESGNKNVGFSTDAKTPVDLYVPFLDKLYEKNYTLWQQVYCYYEACINNATNKSLAHRFDISERTVPRWIESGENYAVHDPAGPRLPALATPTHRRK